MSTSCFSSFFHHSRQKTPSIRGQQQKEEKTKNREGRRKKEERSHAIMTIEVYRHIQHACRGNALPSNFLLLHHQKTRRLNGRKIDRFLFLLLFSSFSSLVSSVVCEILIIHILEQKVRCHLLYIHPKNTHIEKRKNSPRTPSLLSSSSQHHKNFLILMHIQLSISIYVSIYLESASLSISL